MTITSHSNVSTEIKAKNPKNVTNQNITSKYFNTLNSLVLNKMVKDHIQWKPVVIDGALLSGDTNGLICIEECNDYDINELICNKNYKNKRKQDDDDSDEVDVVETKPKSKLKKSKQNNEKKDNKLTPSINGCDGFKVEDNKVIIGDISKDMSAWNVVPLPEVLLKALEEQNFFYPTQIQLLTLPAAIMGKRDILGAAETGSGKTLAFGLPILDGILKQKLKDTKGLNGNANKRLYALILTPTRELAIQIKNHLTLAAKHTGIRMAVVVGGMAAVKQERLLKDEPEIVIATPGRLWELMQQGNEHLLQLPTIKYLAIDETDRMLERGHFQELHDILEKLNAAEECKAIRQNFVFSATLTLIHELPRHVLNKNKFGSRRRNIGDMSPSQKLQEIVDTLGMRNPKVVDITHGKGTSETLTECRISCAIDEKDYYVYYFLQRHRGRTLIFCNSIGCVKRLCNLLGLLDCKPMALHAALPQRQRLKNLDRFKLDEDAVLIATDVAARGLDIPHVDHVIHYQTPRTSESYVHRSGRTARATREGITVLLVEPNELQNYLRLCRTLGKTEDIPQFPVNQRILEAVKQRLRLARELDQLKLHVQRTNSEAGWLEKAAKEMDIIVDEITAKYDKRDSKRYQKEIDAKRKILANLLARPLFPKGFSCKYPLSSGAMDVPYVQGDQGVRRAVDVMKEALNVPDRRRQINVGRKKPKSLFKAKIRKDDNGLNNIKINKRMKKKK